MFNQLYSLVVFDAEAMLDVGKLVENFVYYKLAS